MIDILVRALALVAIIGLGLLAKRLRWASVADFPMFSKLVLYITLPAAIATAFNTMEVTGALLGISVIAVLANLTQQLIAYLYRRRAPGSEKATAVLSIGGFNVGVFATPYISGMLGSRSLVYTSMFDVGNALGMAGIGYSVGMSLAEDRRPSIGAFLGRMFRNPIFDVYMALLIMRLLELSIPEPAMMFIGTVGAANPFLAMFMVGIGLELKMPRSRAATAVRWLAVRYAVSIVLALAVWFLLPWDQTVRAVICTVLFAPVGTQAPILTAEARGDVQLSSLMVTISILVGIVAMPAVLVGLMSL